MRKSVAILMTLVSLSTLTELRGQWQKHLIDDDIHYAVSVDTADLDGDSRLDLIVAAFRDNELVWYQNKFPSWVKHIIDTAAAGITFAYCGDMDGNGTIDIAANLCTAGKTVWYENRFPEWIKHVIDDETDYADFTVVADMNGDGSPDVVTAGNGLRGGDVVWFENRYPEWIEHIIESGSHCNYTIHTVDVDKDGLMDVVVSRNRENRVVWFKNHDRGKTWTTYIIDDSLSNACGTASGDLAGSSSTDVVATNGGPYFPGSEVIWYENHGTSWDKHVLDTDLPGAHAPVVTDVNEDNASDIMVTAYRQNSVLWFENHHPDWVKHYIDRDLHSPRFLMVTDLDGDDLNDVIATADSCVVWYKHPDMTNSSGR